MAQPAMPAPPPGVDEGGVPSGPPGEPPPPHAAAARASVASAELRARDDMSRRLDRAPPPVVGPDHTDTKVVGDSDPSGSRGYDQGVSCAQILLVEDDRDLAGTLAHVLGAAGYPVRWARTGDEALEEFSLARITPGLVLLDLGLPDMSGVQFGTRLQTHARPPLILITASTQEVLNDAVVRLRADASLRKPFDVDSLLKTVRETLAAHTNVRPPRRFSGH